MRRRKLCEITMMSTFEFEQLKKLSVLPNAPRFPTPCGTDELGYYTYPDEAVEILLKFRNWVKRRVNKQEADNEYYNTCLDNLKGKGIDLGLERR